MAKFRKKPVVIEAVQWGFIPQDAHEFLEVICRGTGNCPSAAIHPHIHTLEGVMEIGALDWISRGVNGEFYPCKPDIFEKTYERVED